METERTIKRTIIHINGSTSGVDQLIVDDDAQEGGFDPVASELVCLPSEYPFAHLRGGALANGELLAAGQALMKDLMGNTAIREALRYALRGNVPEVRPIYFTYFSPTAEALPWEVLYHDAATYCQKDPGWPRAIQDFLALDEGARWPIGRIVRHKKSKRPVRRTYLGPLRVSIVLGADRAADRNFPDGSGEWDAIFGSLLKSKEPVQLQVLFCDEAVEAAVAQARGKTGARIQLDPSTGYLIDEKDFREKLKEFRPQVLHLFCHGRVDSGAGKMILANRIDWGGRWPGSIEVGAEWLAGIDALQNDVWIVVLNCCQGAAPPDGERSLAWHLVQYGIPAAVAMREKVDIRTANEFSAAFYESLWEEVGRAAKRADAAADSTTEMEWAVLLSAVRRHLLDKADPAPNRKGSARVREWYLPSLYVRPEEFILSKP